MFSKKRLLQITCDTFIDLYNKCDIGCEMCKFNQQVKKIKENTINFDDYKNQKVLFCYKTDPYVKDNYELVESAINKLHQNNCKIVFLTRKVNSLKKQLYLFNKSDYIGVSISENSSKNSKIEDIIETFTNAKKLRLKTWISLEPVLTSEYANKIIGEVISVTDFIRIGKDDLIDYDFKHLASKIPKDKKVYIKN